jgi:hypothetical protein
MRRLSTLVAALATVFAMGSANALVILVDDFNTPDLFVADQAGGTATTVSDAVRSVTHLLTAGSNTVGGAGSSVTIGTISDPAGSLNVNNGINRNSNVDVNWSLPVGFLNPAAGNAVFFLFNVIQSDFNPVNVSFSFTDLSNVTMALQGFAIPGNTTNQPLSFGATPAEKALINAGGTLTMSLTGGQGWDIALDSLGFQVPEPTSVALVGLALLGAGVASRRRKA